MVTETYTRRWNEWCMKLEMAKLNMARIKKTKMNDGRIWITTVEDHAVAYWFKNYDNHGIIYDKTMNKVGSWKIVDN